jgi:glycosyltransferase involved in cell wall biosynthesis
MDVENLITIVIPSYNQGQYLEQALESVFTQNLSVEVFVMDGGSTDNSVEIIKKWAAKLAGWRSHKDSGQSAAINEGISLGSAPYVCWLNSDDYLLPDKLVKLLDILEGNPQVPMAYGRVDNVIDLMGKSHAVRVEPFSQARLADRPSPRNAWPSPNREIFVIH